MKKRSKVIAIALCLCVFGTMALGSGSSDSGKDKEITSVTNVSEKESASETPAEAFAESTQAETAEEKVEESTPAAEPASQKVSIDERVLYDADNIKITASSLGDSWAGPTLKLLIENNSDRSVTVQARNASVNGFMVETMMSADVAAGKKANDELTFLTSGLEECGIDTIAVMEFSLHIFDSEDWTDITETDSFTIETSAAANYTQEVDDSGEVLVETNGIKIVGKGLSADDSVWGPGLILYIENNSDQNITVQVRDVSVNGYMVESMMSEDVTIGKKAITAVQFFSSDLEENQITDITDVELYFHVFNLESWDTIYDSDVINIAF